MIFSYRTPPLSSGHMSSNNLNKNNIKGYSPVLNQKVHPAAKLFPAMSFIAAAGI